MRRGLGCALPILTQMRLCMHGNKMWACVHAGAPSCSTPTIRQVLGMTAGIVDITGCNYTAGSWQTDYCVGSQPDFASLVQDAIAGNITTAELISTFLWHAPLEYRPGEGYMVSPAGYWFVVAIIEKLTGLTLAEYLEANIFRPANLDNTFSGTPFSPGAALTPCDASLVLPPPVHGMRFANTTV